MRITLGLLIILFQGFSLFAQPSQDASRVCVNEAEAKLASLINEYRRSKNLKPIPLSKSLTQIAQLHVRDLQDNFKSGTRCNLHSWSDDKRWSSCCYTDDHKKAECMWDKPRELTSYKGDGYEIAYFSNYDYANDIEFVEDALRGWKSSKGHNEIIINTGKWLTAEWKAMGVAVYGDYTVVWFGELTDQEGRPDKCTINTANINPQ